MIEWLTAITDPLNHTTSLTRDGRGRVIAVVDALNHSWSYDYNGEGQVVSITDPLNHQWTVAWDHGDPASLTDPLGRIVRRFTDGAGRPLRVTDPLGGLLRLSHDPVNGILQTTDPNGALIALAYNAAGKVSSVTDPRGGVTGYGYDTSNRLALRTDPLGATDQYTAYDGFDQPLTVIDRKGQLATRSYDEVGRLHTVSYADGATVSYTWDKGDRLTQLVDSVSGTITRTYTGLDQLASETTAQGTFSYQYALAGRPQSMTLIGQPSVNYTFDAADRLTGISQGAASVSFSYDEANRRQTLTLANGIVGSYAYDAASRLTGVSYARGGTSVGSLSYGTDAAGRIVARGGSLFQSVPPAAVTSASYDAANRLTHWITAGGGVTPSYDANGNMTHDGSRTLTWDARNRLTAISGVASFAYDGFGRRGAATIGGTTRSFLYDRWNPVKEYTNDLASAVLLTGRGIDQRFSRTTGTGTSHYLTDALGSTVALADDSGVVQTSYGYSPYGVTSASGAANDNSFQFTGRENDTTGLYFYRARYYNPTLGRFISQDPIGLRGGINLYGYVGGDPVSRRDPHGKQSVPSGLVLAVAGYGAGAGGSICQDLWNGQNPDWDAANRSGLAVGLVTGAIGAGDWTEIPVAIEMITNAWGAGILVGTAKAAASAQAPAWSPSPDRWARPAPRICCA